MIVKVIVNNKTTYNKEINDDTQAIRTYDNFVKVYRNSIANNTVANIQLLKDNDIIVQNTFKKRI